MKKDKKTFSIPNPITKWLEKLSKETGESMSALLTRLLIRAKQEKWK